MNSLSEAEYLPTSAGRRPAPNTAPHSAMTNLQAAAFASATDAYRDATALFALAFRTATMDTPTGDIALEDFDLLIKLQGSVVDCALTMLETAPNGVETSRALLREKFARTRLLDLTQEAADIRAAR